MKKRTDYTDMYLEEESVLDYCDFKEYFNNHFRNSATDCYDKDKDDQHPFFEPKIYRRIYDE